MKKIIALILAVLACTAILASCSGSKDIYYFEYDGIKIALGEKADGVLEKLGKPTATNDLGNCGGVGANTKYVYQSFDLYTLEENGVEMIDQIEFSNDLVQTSKGISIGASKEEVSDAYGEATAENSTRAEYTKDNMTLRFTFANGKVTKITYIRKTA